jgi:hypothetical protein
MPDKEGREGDAGFVIHLRAYAEVGIERDTSSFSMPRIFDKARQQA